MTNDNIHNAADRSKTVSQHYSQFQHQRAPGSVLGLGSSSHSKNPQSYLDSALALRHNNTVFKKLCQAYLDRVDPLVRVFHRPSLMDFLLDGKSYLGYRDTDPVLDVLMSAVFFVAVVSLTEERCHALFDANKTSLIATYRFACELALDRVGLITTEDITVLQSFVLYLVRTDARIPAPSCRWYILIPAQDRRPLLRPWPHSLDSVSHCSSPCRSFRDQCGQ